MPGLLLFVAVPEVLAPVALEPVAGVVAGCVAGVEEVFPFLVFAGVSGLERVGVGCAVAAGAAVGAAAVGAGAGLAWLPAALLPDASPVAALLPAAGACESGLAGLPAASVAASAAGWRPALRAARAGCSTGDGMSVTARVTACTGWGSSRRCR